MDQPELYLKTRIQSQRDFDYVTEKYFGLLTFKECCNVLDVGCGPGNVTAEQLFPHLPETTKNIVGVDISQKMVDYAKNKYQKQSKIRFERLDILSDNIPKDFRDNFDHIFSFYCLQIVSNHKKVLENMYKMLKPGGSIFLAFQGKMIHWDIYKTLANTQKWKPYLHDYKNLLCETLGCEQPDVYYTNLLRELDYNVDFCNVEEMVMVYSKEMFKAVASAVNIFEMPKSLEEDFIEDQLSLLKDYNLVDTSDNGEENIRFIYSLLTVYASKC